MSDHTITIEAPCLAALLQINNLLILGFHIHSRHQCYEHWRVPCRQKLYYWGCYTYKNIYIQVQNFLWRFDEINNHEKIIWLRGPYIFLSYYTLELFFYLKLHHGNLILQKLLEQNENIWKSSRVLRQNQNYEILVILVVPWKTPQTTSPTICHTFLHHTQYLPHGKMLTLNNEIPDKRKLLLLHRSSSYTLLTLFHLTVKHFLRVFFPLSSLENSRKYIAI